MSDKTKKAARARMAATGEGYTTALMHVRRAQPTTEAEGFPFIARLLELDALYGQPADRLRAALDQWPDEDVRKLGILAGGGLSAYHPAKVSHEAYEALPLAEKARLYDRHRQVTLWWLLTDLDRLQWAVYSAAADRVHWEQMCAVWPRPATMEALTFRARIRDFAEGSVVLDRTEDGWQGRLFLRKGHGNIVPLQLRPDGTANGQIPAKLDAQRSETVSPAQFSETLHDLWTQGRWGHEDLKGFEALFR